MLELSGFKPLVEAAGTIYFLLMLCGIALALWKGRTWKGKLGFAVLVFALFMAPLVSTIYDGMVYRSKLAKAQALFDERCKTAGEKIYRTVEGVEGFMLIKVRPKGINHSEQFAMNDPYGSDLGGADISCSCWQEKMTKANQVTAFVRALYTNS